MHGAAPARRHARQARSKRWCSPAPKSIRSLACLSLREREPFTLIATAASLDALADNPMFDVLAPDLVARQAAAPAQPFSSARRLQAQVFHRAGQGAALSRRRRPCRRREETGANVGVEILAGDARHRLCSRRRGA